MNRKILPANSYKYNNKDTRIKILTSTLLFLRRRGGGHTLESADISFL